jgi:two-component system, NtrC family, sensor histidine kinase PilS
VDGARQDEPPEDQLSLLVRQLRILNVARLVVVAAVVAPWFLLALLGPPAGDSFLAHLTAQAYQEANPSAVAMILVGTLLLVLAYEACLRLGYPAPKALAYFELGADLILVSGLVYTFGGIHSPFSMFYPVVIFLASYLFGRQAPATGFASAALVLYSILLTGLYVGWKWPPATSDVEPELTYRVTYNVVVALVGFYTVALLASTLAGRTRRAEEELEDKRVRLESLQVVYQDVIQSIVSGLITTSQDGVVSSANRAAQKMLGREDGGLVGRPITESGLFSEEDWHRCQAWCDDLGRALEEVEIDRDGHRFTIGFSLTPLQDARGISRGYIAIFQDLTEKRKLQEELRVKDRMAAVGMLAAGIAHEVGNPLAAISGSAQMLSRALDRDEPGRRLLEIILKESQRLDRTIKGFLRFARPRDSSLARFDVGELLREHFTLLSNSEEVRDPHRLVLDVETAPVIMVADADQVSQIFWNLSRNALRAMPDGGTLELSGYRHEPDSFRLRFTDTGQGMPEDQRAKLFEPFQGFFDRGTGIGMAIVYRIVQEHGGRLQVESVQGRGTTIIVDLPLTPVQPAVLEAAEV